MMNKRTSASARIAAVAALVAALVLAIAILGGAFDGGSDGSDGKQGGDSGQQAEKPKRKAPATYTVKSGDTLIGIASDVGVPVGQIEALNPGVDPQILVAGEELKLR
jgi:LysM repeat protein